LLFIPNPNNYPEVDHKDGNRMNPTASNLEWVLHQENIRRAYLKGSYKNRIRGEKNPKAKLNEDKVRQLRLEYSSGITVKALSDKYGIPWSTIGNIVHRKTWKHIA
jgi:hypothetical protein